MRTIRTRQAMALALCLVTGALAAYLGVRYARANTPSPELTTRIEAAVDNAAPRDTVQLDPRLVRSGGGKGKDFNIYGYDYAKIDRLAKEYRDIPRVPFLQDVFARATKGHEGASDNEKWLAVMDYFYHTIRHAPVEQPMYADGTMVTDPLMLLELHEGRCGHVARVIVDVALANHYNARLLQLAAHLVAEVNWGGKWHWVDADSGIPVDSLRARYAELPSVAELARTPHVLDSLAFRNWQWRADQRRTLDGVVVPEYTNYPGDLLPSSVYFGRQIFTAVFGGRRRTATVLTYHYKQGDISQWDGDRYWGWQHLRIETEEIPTVPVDYAPFHFTITGPEAVYLEGGHAVVPVRWTAEGRPNCQADDVRNCTSEFDKLGYEVRVSRATRGWNYDFRDYDYMPKRGAGDLLVTRNVRKIDASTYGIDVPIHDHTDLFIEVVPVALDQEHSSEFMWPSNEITVRIVPRTWTEANR